MGQAVPFIPPDFYADRWYCVTEWRYPNSIDGCTGDYIEEKCCRYGQGIYDWVMNDCLCNELCISLCTAANVPTQFFIGAEYMSYIDCWLECV